MIPRRKQKISLPDLFNFLFNYLPNKKSHYTSEFRKNLLTETELSNLNFTSSGRGAILLGLKTLGLVPGDEIIISALNLGELVPLLQGQGYIVKIADINTEDLSIDHQELKKLISEKTKLILITHLFSLRSRYDELIKIAREKELMILEDCAHTLDYLGKENGEQLSDCLIFSFEVNKPLATYGGGALAFRKNSHSEKAFSELKQLSPNNIKLLKKMILSHIEEMVIFSPFFKTLISILSHPLIQKYFEKAYRATNTTVRAQAAYHPYQAYLGLEELKRVGIRNKILFSIVKDFQSINSSKLRFFKSLEDQKYFYSFVFIADNPQKLKKLALKNDIDTGIGSEVIDDCSKYFEGINTPNAKAIESNIVLFPLYHDLSIKKLTKLKSFLLEYSNDN